MESRIEREKQTVRMMIELYCRHRLKQDTMPDEYQQLAEFACRRLDHCKYGEHKTACKDCPTHCYAPKEREGTDRIAVRTRTAKLGNKSFHLEQEIFDTDTQEVKSRCLSILVLYDLEQKLSMPFPDEWRKAISDYDGVINIEAK